MNVSIYPSHFILDKAFEGSKSLAHRFIIASFLANEALIIDNVPENDDIEATLNFFKALKHLPYTIANILLQMVLRMP